MLRRAARQLLSAGRKPSSAYEHLVATGCVRRDEHQAAALPVFDRLYEDLENFLKSSARSQPRHVELRPPNRLGVVPSFFRLREQQDKLRQALAEIDGSAGAAAYHPLSHVKGLYVYGGVGCGKTMLMDLLYDNVSSELGKRRVHFHHFILDVLATLHSINYQTNDSRPGQQPQALRTPDASTDPFDEVAQRMIGSVELLCFDEVAVSDVAHAMILRRLFHAFYKSGLVVIFTSNRPPDELYLGGLNREAFLPFIDLVKRQCVVYDMRSETDHRLSGSDAETYISPITDANTKKFNKMFLQICKGMPTAERVLRVFGRDVRVEAACGGACRFHFSQICGDAMSAADYAVIARTFHTVFIEGVPRFSYHSSDIKHRFLLLVDELYEYRCKLVIYAQVELSLLQESRGEHDAASAQLASDPMSFDRGDAQLTEFEREAGGRLVDESDSSFQMKRCLSRLSEMRSLEYLKSPCLCPLVSTFV
ncbi:putative AFG1 like ATPase [Trypanosoma vivax]|nr:putative AFG1 like ATPase [Trypanosoma vivax]